MDDDDADRPSGIAGTGFNVHHHLLAVSVEDGLVQHHVPSLCMDAIRLYREGHVDSVVARVKHRSTSAGPIYYFNHTSMFT